VSTPAQSDRGGSSPAEREAFAATTGYAAQLWSAEKPKAEGWWWVQLPKYPDLKVVVRVYRSPNETLCVYMHAGGHKMMKDTHGYWWAGPLPEPLDAPDVEPPHSAQDQQRAGESASAAGRPS
jgi:hypothetical protein